ncbi:hypothetical protein ANANG_G00181680, partial [Anguilla anguilla]
GGGVGTGWGRGGGGGSSLQAVSQQQTAAFGGACLTQDAVLGSGQVLDQGPEVLEADAFAFLHPHHLQHLPETLLIACRL